MESSAGARAASDPYTFPLPFYYRMANQIVRQAKVYREEGNADDLYRVLTKYIRLLLEFIPRHQDYPIYSSEEKPHHTKILQGFVKEQVMVESLLAKRESSGNRQVKCCVAIGTKSPSMNAENAGCMPMVASDAMTGNRPSGTPPLVALTAGNHDCNLHAVTHYSPSPIISWIENDPLESHVSHVIVPDSKNGKLKSLCREHSTSKAIHDVHISVGLMEEFMALASANTNNDLETCGVLGASFKNRTFYVTTLIVPKQESTSGSCQALHEEEIYAVQDEMSLFPVGWIHTHPSQSCFMSSIDLHTQYSYQVMLPEAVAIVMAPKDTSRSYGIFRLTDPEGTNVLKQCKEGGFHPHEEPADGTPIYEDCSNVYINPNLRFEVIDLRCSS